MDAPLHVLYLSVSVFCYCLFVLHYISEVNIVLFTQPHLLDSNTSTKILNIGLFLEYFFTLWYCYFYSSSGTSYTTELGQQKIIVLDTQVISGKVEKKDILDNLFKYFIYSQITTYSCCVLRQWLTEWFTFDKLKFIILTPNKYLSQ